MIKLELCTSSVEDGIIKSTLVDQIEFCANLEVGGLTPDLADAKRLRSKVGIPIKIMIRHRGGDFIFDASEQHLLLSQARQFLDEGFDRLVFGATHQDGRLNITQILEFCMEVFPAKVCIHKAIDESPQIMEDLGALLQIENIDEVLTSGGKLTAWEGKEVLNKMVNISSHKISIIAAGSIRHHNLIDHKKAINTPIFHGRLIV
jgi:copper homeostasis protein